MIMHEAGCSSKRLQRLTARALREAIRRPWGSSLENISGGPSSTSRWSSFHDGPAKRGGQPTPPRRMLQMLADLQDDLNRNQGLWPATAMHGLSSSSPPTNTTAVKPDDERRVRPEGELGSSSSAQAREEAAQQQPLLNKEAINIFNTSSCAPPVQASSSPNASLASMEPLGVALRRSRDKARELERRRLVNGPPAIDTAAAPTSPSNSGTRGHGLRHSPAKATARRGSGTKRPIASARTPRARAGEGVTTTTSRVPRGGHFDEASEMRTPPLQRFHGGGSPSTPDTRLPQLG